MSEPCESVQVWSYGVGRKAWAWACGCGKQEAEFPTITAAIQNAQSQHPEAWAAVAESTEGRATAEEE